MSREFSSAWLASREARIAIKSGNGPSVPAGGVDDEIEGLHGPIIEECQRRGWRYIHSDPYKKSTVGAGVCDFIILADKGRVFFFECKKKGGKLSFEQCIFITWIKKLGHECHVITSMNEFMEVMK